MSQKNYVLEVIDVKGMSFNRLYPTPQPLPKAYNTLWSRSSYKYDVTVILLNEASSPNSVTALTG